MKRMSAAEKYDLNSQVSILPVELLNHIKKGTDSADLNTIVILLDLLYQDNLEFKNKEQEIEISYKDIGKKFNLPLLRVKNSIQKLESQGLITKAIRLNKVFITLNLQELDKVTEGIKIGTEESRIIFTKLIKLRSVKLSMLSIILLGQILYFNKDELSEGLYNKKRNIKWNANYAYLQEKLGFSRETLRRALIELESFNLVKRHFKVITDEEVGVRNNTMIIEVNTPKVIEMIGKMILSYKNTKAIA